MRRPFRRGTLAFASGWLLSVAARAETLPKPVDAPPTGRETFLIAVIGAMMLCGLVSFFLRGRVSERTHVALAMLNVLCGAFGLLVLFGGSLYTSPVAAVFVVLLLFVLFKFMSQFESSRGGKPTKE